MSTVRADNYGNRIGSSSIPADTLLQGTAKAWLNLNGTGIIAARDSFNVSSVTDFGTGTYSTALSTAMPNANYVITGMARLDTGSGTSNIIVNQYRNSAQATSGYEIGCQNLVPAFADCDRVFECILGDSA